MCLHRFVDYLRLGEHVWRSIITEHIKVWLVNVVQLFQLLFGQLLQIFLDQF